MITGKELKKVFPYFNKILTAMQKERSFINIYCINGVLTFSLIESDSVCFQYIVKTDFNDFKTLSFNYSELECIFSEIKAKDEVSIYSTEYQLHISINEIIYTILSDTQQINAEFEYMILTQTTNYALLKCIGTNKVCTNKPLLNYSKNIYFNLENNTLNIYNTNDIAIVFNSINCNFSGIKKQFAIDNDVVSDFYKWLVAVKNTNIGIGINDNYLFFVTKNELIKLRLIEVDEINTIISHFKSFSNIDLKLKREMNIALIKEDVLNINKGLTKEDILLSLPKSFHGLDIKDINISKRIFVNFIKTALDESTIGIVDNTLSPILISHIDENYSQKIIININH